LAEKTPIIAEARYTVPIMSVPIRGDKPPLPPELRI